MITILASLLTVSVQSGVFLPFPGARGGIELRVIRAESTWVCGTLPCSYIVEGVALSRREENLDTLFWVAPLPAMAVPSLSGSGISEERTLDLVSAGASWVSAGMTVRLLHPGGRISTFTAYRTWLTTGEELDLDKVIQRDSLFDSRLGTALGIPGGSSPDSWLWRMGFWFDPMSFAILPGNEGEPVIRLGLPSAEGLDTLLTVDLPVIELNTASGSMLD
jgi:hypothetical protein